MPNVAKLSGKVDTEEGDLSDSLIETLSVSDPVWF